ncbi:MAG: sulfatase [Candidatus Nealsonbacteria bacterium]|nr:sulfatase [Candidatus Nealsonbacteria bacterium]
MFDIRYSFCLLFFFALPCTAATSPPNIVFVLVDDLGWMDTSVYGSQFYETPNVDRLAKQGMRFTNAYAANPLCSPTRASILTGQYPGRLRFTTPAGHLPQVVLDPQLPERGPPRQKAVTPPTRTRLPNDYFTVAEALKEAGYTTGFFGKWHLGRDPYLPDNQGFDVVVGGREHPGPPGGYFAPWPIETIPVMPAGTHICDVLTDEAIKFIEHNRKGPFLLNLWFYDVHAPFQAKEKLIEKYRGKVDPECPQRCPTMGAMIEVMDQNLGRVLDVLRRLEIVDETIIVFTSDNGGNMYNEVDGTTPTNNAPLRNGKGSIYEGGTRVPLIVVWPGVVSGGSTSEAIVSSVDYYPTLLEMVGRKPKPGQVLDGLSIVPVLRGGETLERDGVFCHFPHYMPATDNLPSTSVRQGDWKLIRLHADGDDQADRFELYDLSNDVGESRNLAVAMPEKVRELDRLIARHLRDTAALVPFANPAYRAPVAGWFGNQHAATSRKDGCLRIESSGGDPFIQISKLPQTARPAALEIRMKSNSRGHSRVYWTAGQHRTFHRDRSAGFDTVHDGRWHDYSVTLSAAAPLRALRLDPSQAPGTIEIQSMKLVDRQGKVIVQWDFGGGNNDSQ